MPIHAQGRYPAAALPTDPVGRKRMQLLDGLVAGEPADRVELGANLARMDTGALAFARAQGLQFVVVRPGDRLEQTGALRSQELEPWKQRLPELKELGDALYANRAGMSIGSFLSESGKPLTPCGQGASPLSPECVLDPQAVTVAQWAAWHGASNAEETAVFEELLRGINGPRMGQEPVLNTVSQGLLAPELYFYGPPEQRMMLDRYDRDAVLLWQGSHGRVVEDGSQAVDGGARGQLFPEVNRILIRERALNGDRTAVHELAHGVDFLIEKQAPEWYGSWKGEMEQAFARARQRGTITDYAKANLREYLAEGIAHVVFEKEKLKQTDPDLCRLSEAMLAKAAQLAGVDPELERSHLTLLAATQEQVSRALQSAQANPAQSRAELSSASVQLKTSIAAMKSATQLLQFGMLAGAVDGVLQYVLATTPPDLAPDQARALEQASRVDTIETAFQASESGQKGALQEEVQMAYLAGASLAYRITNR